MRKVHANAKLKTLAESIQDSLWTWLGEDQTRTLQDATAWLADEHQIDTDLRRISEWRAWYARKVEIDAAQSEAAEITDALSRLHLADARQLEQIGNLIFLNRATKQGDAKTFTQVAAVLQGRDRLDAERAKIALAERRLTLLEQQASAATGALTQAALSPEERLTTLRQIFGLPS